MAGRRQKAPWPIATLARPRGIRRALSQPLTSVTKSDMRNLPPRATSAWHPFYARRFRSALLVLVGGNAFARLEFQVQRQVDRKCKEIHDAMNPRPPYPWGIRQRLPSGPSAWPNDDFFAVWHGIAMAHLRLPTGVDGLHWEAFVSGSAMRNPFQAFFSFVRFDPATDDAVAFLADAGFSMDERSTQAHEWMRAIRGHYP